MRAQAQTTSGVVTGRVAEGGQGGAAFLGVPYAAPPIGARRFDEPEPAPAWSGEREATRYGPAQPQHDSPHQQLLGLTAPEPHAEDCLNLNVWTPGVEGARPVLVWFHGGGFSSGTSSVEAFDGGVLSARGDIVVVTLNYRVGALGYLYLGRARCNFGLRDQIAGLRWIRDNIANFGGDPARVTICGGSAGGGSVCALMVSPAARGLFHAAIAQSPAPDGFLSMEEASERTALMFETLEKAGHTVDRNKLGALPVSALLTAQASCAAARQWKTGMFFAPVIDRTSVPARPLELFARGAEAKVPLLIGTNRDELQLFKYGVPTPPFGLDAAVGVIGQSLPGIEVKPAVEGFMHARSARGESVTGMDLIYAFHTELAIRLPSIGLAQLHAARQPDTFMYLFDWRSPAQDGELGAFHGLEQLFLFGRLGEVTGGGEQAEAVSAQLMDAWIAFVRTGCPATPEGGAGTWPRYEATQRQTLRLGAQTRVESDPFAAERELLSATLAPNS